MKEFDLELAKQGYPVYTRNGRKARIVCFDRKANNYPIIALVSHMDSGLEDAFEYTIDGKRIDSSRKKDLDLMIETRTVTKWAEMYQNVNGSWTICFHDTQEKAESQVNRDQGFVAKIEWEE